MKRSINSYNSFKTVNVLDPTISSHNIIAITLNLFSSKIPSNKPNSRSYRGLTTGLVATASRFSSYSAEIDIFPPQAAGVDGERHFVHNLD